ncbi:GTP:AMP phosphotransferase AK3, mitochondrial-like isoform X2 [Amphiura filiformis]|uniref:GTP:AMP phosphotransferase AK3, mitochondrial-like isoform X2 n=1 Tax=Amphiura filiformis TaxID=82378 RepID=UPI003B2123B7
MSKLFRSVILGPPGSGKGTISSRLVRDFGLTHLSSGDILRAQINKGAGKPSEAALQAKGFMEKGQLVPDNLMVRLVLNELSHISEQSWLLDGFPRTVSQAQALTQELSIDSVIRLIIPFDVLTKRLEGRWVHPASGRVYNLEWNPPKVEGKDDDTGEALVQRDDDKPETVRARLQLYTKLTEPVFGFYKNLGILQDFSGTETNQIWPHVHRYVQFKLTHTHGHAHGHSHHPPPQQHEHKEQQG